MQFHVIVKKRAPAVVITKLEKCIWSRSQMVLRTEASIVAFGMVESQDSAQRFDMTSFYLAALDDSTLIKVEIEEQRAQLDFAEEQHNVIRSRLEAVFECLQDQLGCEPIHEVIEVDDDEEEPKENSDVAKPAPRLIAAFAENTNKNEEEFYKQELVHPVSLEVAEKFSNAEVHSGSRRNLNISDAFGFSSKSFALAVLVLIGAIATIWSINRALSLRSTANVLPKKPDRNLPAPVLAQPPSSGSMKQAENKSAQAMTDVKEIQDWLEQWAASQRMHSADTQTSFYAGKVSPYLHRIAATHSDVYRDKQRAIRSRQGLWTFNIEDVSIDLLASNIASVTLKKHYMSQNGEISVSERFIPSHLTLMYVGDSWKIIGEEDFQ